MPNINTRQPIDMQVDAYVSGDRPALCDLSDFIDGLVDALVEAWGKIEGDDDAP